MSGLFWIGLAMIVLWAIAWLGFQAAGWFLWLILLVGIVLLILGLVRRATSQAP
jgi:hypothetical protein